ncbi:LysR family transcriptional regulator [Litoribacillus peritrichatus]|uniref:LysR family transcriptional regulator n=1 Tax=Litoribacillus peritrichatus TaxID=718191 RepID=A0ABP7MHH0_9GAMM
MDLNELALFVEVVDQNGFTAAAKRLGLPKSNVSRRISQLEDSLGVKLLERTSRSVAMTEVGEVVYERSKQNIRDLQETESLIPELQNNPRGRLRIEAPGEFGIYFMGSVIGEFSMLYPDIDIHCETVFEEGNIIEDKIDLAIRASLGNLPDSSFIARKISEPTRGLYASPHYLNRHGTPKTVEDLADHDLIENAQGPTWRFEGENGPFDIQLNSRIRSNSVTMKRDAMIAGAGISILPDLMAREAVQLGQLVKVELDYKPVRSEIYVIYTSRRHMPVKLRLFLDFFAKKMASDKRLSIPSLAS